MASVSILVASEGELSPSQQEALEYLRLQADALSAPAFSSAHGDALDALCRFTTRRAAVQSRAYADCLRVWDPRRWKALFDAWRFERELAEADA